MSDLIACCGIDCGECKGYLATKKADPKMRKAVAEEWSKQYGHPFKPEEVNCLGCTPADGPHLGYCGICEIRKCCREKMLPNCAGCAEYRCGRLEELHKKAAGAGKNLDRLRKSPGPRKQGRPGN